MEFCPKCGAVLIQKRKNAGCPRCNYNSKDKINIKTSEKMDEIKDVAVIKKVISANPVVEETCKKCKNNRAYFWTVQMRAADEAEVRFFKCTKCEYTWKEYR